MSKNIFPKIIQKDDKFFIKKDSIPQKKMRSDSLRYKFLDGCAMVYQKRDQTFMPIIVGGSGVKSIILLFLAIASYFEYGKDINKMLGFVGWCIILAICILAMAIPFGGFAFIGISIYYFAPKGFAFFELYATRLSSIVYNLAIILGIILSILTTITIIGQIEEMNKSRKRVL